MRLAILEISTYAARFVLKAMYIYILLKDIKFKILSVRTQNKEFANDHFGTVDDYSCGF